MSRRIRLFPLPGVVLLPGTLLPLHIFEPRYRALVADALAGDRTIGMAMIKPGFDALEPAPPVYPVGGGGEIVESELLEDGRYNILLRGIFRYRILEERPPSPFRSARIAPLDSLPFSSFAEETRTLRRACDLFGELRAELELPSLPEETLSCERLCSEIALRLRYTPEELQALLETDSLAERFRPLIGRLTEWRRRTALLAPFRPEELDVTRN